MKNINISPTVSFIGGIALIVLARLLFFNQSSVIIEAIQAFGFIVAIIGFAGLLGKFLKKIFKKD